jgi:hypothetical protein
MRWTRTSWTLRSVSRCPRPTTSGSTSSPDHDVSSTWQYPDKTFAEMYRRHQEEDLPIYTWCYRETSNPIDGWLDPDFIEEKKRQIPAEMWRVEYELGEPSIGNRAFDSEAVERMFGWSPRTQSDQDRQGLRAVLLR